MPVFKKSQILTIPNLYYITAFEAKKVLCSEKPAAISKIYQIDFTNFYAKAINVMQIFQKEYLEIWPFWCF